MRNLSCYHHYRQDNVPISHGSSSLRSSSEIMKGVAPLYMNDIDIKFELVSTTICKVLFHPHIFLYNYIRFCCHRSPSRIIQYSHNDPGAIIT